jgi:hypothetical protein
MYGHRRLNDTMHCIVEPCPIDYFGSEDKRAIRITTFENENRVSIIDIYLTDDTRYTLYVSVDEPYQNGIWWNLVKTYDPGVLAFMDRPNAVWYRPGEWIIEDKPRLLDGLKEMKDYGILQTDRVFSYGALNDVYDI